MFNTVILYHYTLLIMIIQGSAGRYQENVNDISSSVNITILWYISNIYSIYTFGNKFGPYCCV